jgi:hypothetical protein
MRARSSHAVTITAGLAVSIAAAAELVHGTDWTAVALFAAALIGAGAPPMAALTSWLVREGESGKQLLTTGGFELGGEGVVAAVPLRRENSALVGFLVLGLSRRLPAHAELALAEGAGDLALTLVERPDEPEVAWPALRAGGLEHA